MSIRMLSGGRRRWLVAALLAGVTGIAGSTTAFAGGAFANGTSSSCAEADQAVARTQSGLFETDWVCDVPTVSTNVTPLPTNTSSGVLRVTATYSGSVESCGTVAGSQDLFTISYEDSFGGWTVSGMIPYATSDLSTCLSNYAGLTTALPVTNTFGLYNSMNEMCVFSIQGQFFTGSNTIAAGPDTGPPIVSFGVDSGSGCKPAN